MAEERSSLPSEGRGGGVSCYSGSVLVHSAGETNVQGYLANESAGTLILLRMKGGKQVFRAF